MILSDKDRTALDKLEDLLLNLLEDHRGDPTLTMHVVTGLDAALHEVRLAKRYMGGG